MGGDVLGVDDAADDPLEACRRLLIGQQVQLALLDIADARRKAEAEKVAEAEHMIGDVQHVGDLAGRIALSSRYSLRPRSSRDRSRRQREPASVPRATFTSVSMSSSTSRRASVPRGPRTQ